MKCEGWRRPLEDHLGLAEENAWSWARSGCPSIAMGAPLRISARRATLIDPFFCQSYRFPALGPEE